MLDSFYFCVREILSKTNQVDSAYYYLGYSSNSSRLQTQAAAYYHLAQLERFRENWKGYANNQIRYEVLRDSVKPNKENGINKTNRENI